jgi:hypothetical protein
MTTAAGIVSSLQRRGVVLVPAPDGRLRYHPRDALSAEDVAEVARHREAIVALLQRDPVAWRAAVMSTQIAPTGAIPLLMARPGVRMPLGTCCSCGDPLGPDDRYRCGPCVQAAIATLAAPR